MNTFNLHTINVPIKKNLDHITYLFVLNSQCIQIGILKGNKCLIRLKIVSVHGPNDFILRQCYKP